MSALKCDACGAPLAMTEDGKFAVCEFCGMKHTLERIKAKVQEIRGVVEITKGEAEKERLLKNAETFIHLNEEKKAIDIYHSLTDDFPDDYRGWHGLAKISIEHGMSLMDAIEKSSDPSDRNTLCSSLFVHLHKLCYLGEKIRYLNGDAYAEVEAFEARVIESGKTQPFLNPISLYFLENYEKVCGCSDKLRSWADSLAAEYVTRYERGEFTVLVWKYSTKAQLERDVQQNLNYACAKDLWLKGFALADRINALAMSERKRVLLVWGVNDVNRLLNEKSFLFFILGTCACFDQNAGSHMEMRVLNRCITDKSINVAMTNAVAVDTSHVCGYCGGTVNNIGFCESCGLCHQTMEAELCENMKSMLNFSLNKIGLLEKIGEAFGTEIPIYDGYKGSDYTRSYSFKEVTTTRITLSYTDTQKGLFTTGLRNGTVGTFSYPEKQFKDVYYFMLKRRGKCLHCGATLTGIINRQCPKCGKPKDY